MMKKNNSEKQLCIICKEPKDNMTEEHIIPDSIGGILKTYNVCKDCNGKLGEKVDSRFLNNSFIILLRHIFGIKNKNNQKVDILKQLPIYDENDEKVILKKGDNINTPSLYTGRTIPEISATPMKDGKTHFEFSGSDIESITTKICRILKDQGKNISKSEIKNLIQTSGKWTRGKEKVSMPICVDAEAYAPCVVKIAYEYAICTLGEEYFEDECGENLRKFLYNSSHGIEEDSKTISVSSSIVIDEISNFHYIRLEKTGARRLLVSMILFGGMKFVVLVSNDADKYNITKKEDFIDLTIKEVNTNE